MLILGDTGWWYLYDFHTYVSHIQWDKFKFSENIQGVPINKYNFDIRWPYGTLQNNSNSKLLYTVKTIAVPNSDV